MFGIGFAELLVIVIAAILFLGPDKLPQTLVQIAKFFNETKRALTSAKNSIEEELHLDEMRREISSLRDEVKNSRADLTTLDDLTRVEPELKSSPIEPKVVKFSKEKSSKEDV